MSVAAQEFTTSRRRRARVSGGRPQVGLHAALMLVFLAYVLPLVFVAVSSFKANVDIMNDPLGLIFTPSLEAYRAVTNSALASALKNSLIISVLATAVTLGAGVPLAYVLSRLHVRWTGIVVGVLIALQMVPASTAVIPLYALLPALNLLGTLHGVALAIAASITPYAVLLLRPFYLAVPREVDEAAEVDGAGPFRRFLLIALPLVRNGVLVITILVYIMAWGEFVFALSFLTESSQFPLSILLVLQQGQYGTQYSNLMALSLIGSIPTIILFLFAARRLTSGLALGAGK